MVVHPGLAGEEPETAGLIPSTVHPCAAWGFGVSEPERGACPRGPLVPAGDGADQMASDCRPVRRAAVSARVTVGPFAGQP